MTVLDFGGALTDVGGVAGELEAGGLGLPPRGHIAVLPPHVLQHGRGLRDREVAVRKNRRGEGWRARAGPFLRAVALEQVALVAGVGVLHACVLQQQQDGLGAAAEAGLDSDVGVGGE